MKLLTILLSILVLAGCKATHRSVSLSSTDKILRAKGLETFKVTTFNYVRTNCAACHSNVQAPYFASTTVAEAFDAIQTKIDWSNIEQSRIVAQAGNGHCGIAVCQNQGAPMIETLKAWKSLWDAQDAAPVIEWTVTSVAFNEGQTMAVLQLQSSLPAMTAFAVSYRVSGTALNPRDHSLSAQGSASWIQGQSQAIVNLGLNDNAVFDGNRTIELQLVAGDGYKLGVKSLVTVTLSDNELTPSVRFASAAQSVIESAGVVQVQVTSSGPSAQEISVPFTIGGTAAAADHGLVNGTVKIPADTTSTIISFPVADDTLPEAIETVIVSLGAPTGAILGTLSQHTVSIADNDSPPVMQFRLANQTGDEGATAVIAVDMASVSSLPVTVPFTISGVAGIADHNLTSGTISFPAGSLTQNLPVILLSDAIIENDETVVVTLGNPVNATLGANKVHTLTIKDKTPAPTVQFAAITQKVSETSGQANVAITLSTASTVAVTIPISVSGSATAGSDFVLSASSVTIPAGQTIQSVTLTIQADAVFENDETVILTMGTPANATLGLNRVHTLTITEGSAPPSIDWSAASQTASEGTASVTVAARLSVASTLAVSVPVTISGTASSGGIDFNFATATLTIPAGVTSQTATINLVNDSIFEGNETVILTMGTPTNANLGAVAAHTLTITDNETQPTIQLQTAAANVLENAGTSSFTVTLSGASSKDASVAYTVAGSATSSVDHGLNSGTVVIPALAMSKAVSFNIVNDTVYEGSETVVVTLTPSSVVGAALGTLGATTITVLDDDTAPLAQFSSSAQSALESGGTATLVVTLDKISSQPVTVPLLVSGTAVANSDYTVPNATVTIAAGSTQGSVNINLINDTLYENAETIIFTLGTPTGAALGPQNTHSVTIQDNDPVPQVQFLAATQTLNEDVGQARIDIRLSAASGLPLSVNYSVSGTALAGTDFTAPTGTLAIAAGAASGSINIAILNDTLAEPDDDTLVLTLTSAAGASLGAMLLHKVTFTDNDSTGDPAIEGFRQSVYKFTRTNCVQCHGTTQIPLHAAYSIPTAYAAAKTKVNFSSIPESTLVIKSKDGHCGLANCMTDGTALIAAIEAWKPYEPVVPVDPGIGSLLITGDTQLRLGTRKFVSSKLVNLFGATEAQTIVDQKINSKPGIFGGSCDLLAGTMTALPSAGYLGDCAERPESHAPPIGVATSQRMALSIRSCDQLVQSDTAIHNAAKAALGVSTSPVASRFPNDADIAAVYGFYYRDRALDTPVADALRGVVTAAAGQGYSSIEGWRFLIMTLCKSPVWQIP